MKIKHGKGEAIVVIIKTVYFWNWICLMLWCILLLLFCLIKLLLQNWTLFGSFILLSYLILFFYVSSIDSNEENKERHHFQDIVLIWQVPNKKEEEDYDKRFMHGIFDKWNFVLVYLFCVSNLTNKKSIYKIFPFELPTTASKALLGNGLKALMLTSL